MYQEAKQPIVCVCVTDTAGRRTSHAFLSLILQPFPDDICGYAKPRKVGSNAQLRSHAFHRKVKERETAKTANPLCLHLGVIKRAGK